MAFDYVLYALSQGKGSFVVDDYDPEKTYQLNEAFRFYGRLYRTTVAHGPEEFAATHNEYITSSQDAIDATAIYDNLTSTRTDKCLSANQGRVLAERVPASPAVDGSYSLKATVSGGSVVYSWETG